MIVITLCKNLQFGNTIKNTVGNISSKFQHKLLSSLRSCKVYHAPAQQRTNLETSVRELLGHLSAWRAFPAEQFTKKFCQQGIQPKKFHVGVEGLSVQLESIFNFFSSGPWKKNFDIFRPSQFQIIFVHSKPQQFFPLIYKIHYIFVITSLEQEKTHIHLNLFERFHKNSKSVYLRPQKKLTDWTRGSWRRLAEGSYSDNRQN